MYIKPRLEMYLGGRGVQGGWDRLIFEWQFCISAATTHHFLADRSQM